MANSTREEIEALIAEALGEYCTKADALQNFNRDEPCPQIACVKRGNTCEHETVARLATLGAAVLQPREDEIEAMAKAMFEAEKKLKRDALGYSPPGYRQRGWGELNEYDQREMRDQARAALSALASLKENG